MYVCMYVCMYIYAHGPVFKELYETTPETGQVSYRFHTPIKNRAVSYPVSYPVEAVWFHTRFHTWFHTSRVTKALRPMESQGPRNDVCSVPAQRTPVRFHTGFIPKPSRPSSSPIWLLCRPPVSYPGFIPWTRGARFHTFHTGFILVSCCTTTGRFHAP